MPDGPAAFSPGGQGVERGLFPAIVVGEVDGGSEVAVQGAFVRGTARLLLVPRSRGRARPLSYNCSGFR